MAAENNIIIKITSETDLTKANVALEELDELSRQVVDDIDRLSQEFKTTKNNIVDAMKAGKLSVEEASKEIGDLTAEYIKNRQALEQENKTHNKAIQTLKKAVNAYNALEGASGKMTQRLRAMREELMRMEEAGEFGSEAFIELSIEAGKLEDQIGDTQQRIRVLASDTKNLDAAMGLGDGLAGMFYIATSGAEILGDEMEGLQKAFYKVQAVMSILSGITQVYNALNKDSAAMVVLNTAVTKLFNKAKLKSAAATSADAVASGADATAKTAEATATGAATAAQWSLNAAFAANPIGAVLTVILATIAAIAAIGVGIAKLVHYFSAAGKAERDYAKASEEYEKIHAQNAINAETRANHRQQQIRATDNEEAEALKNAQARGATQVELDEIKAKYAKRRYEETRKYANEEIRRNNKEVESLKAKRDAAAREAAAYKEGTKKKQEALEKLTEAQNDYVAAVTKGQDLEQERVEAQRAAEEAEAELAEERKRRAQEAAERRREALKEAQSLEIEMMKEGTAKEIAQINATYNERIKAIKGKSKEELRLRKALMEKQAREIAEVERRATEKLIQQMSANAVSETEAIAQAINGDEGVEYQLQVWHNYYAERENQMRENYQLEREEIERTVADGANKAEQLTALQIKLNNDINALNKERAAKDVEIYSQELTDLEIAAKKAQDVVDAAVAPGDRIEALKANLDAQTALYNAQLEDLDRKWAAGLISYQDYKQQEYEITKAITDAEVEYQTNALNTLSDTFTEVVNNIQSLSDMTFELISNLIQEEMDKLDEMYTTDWEEAQKDANKKYITQKEYDKKKADLEMKQAKYAKAQTLINIALQTALSIMTTLAQLGATPWGFAAAAVAGTMGAIQLGIAAAKPLAQYEKGRNGGKGEYALVGEKGPELMYIPEGASIVPNDKLYTPGAWAAFGVPELPHTNTEMLRQVSAQSMLFALDYDKVGEAVAAALPQQQAVVVNVDRNGINVRNGRDTHTYLNTKYTGTWS